MPPTSIGSLGLRLLAVAVLVAANACFVAAEFALVASRRTRLEALRRAGDPRAAVVLKALQTLTRYISGTQLGITLTSLALGWIGEPAIAASLESLLGGLPVALAVAAAHTIAVLVAFALITFLHVVLGELVPKAVALLYPETLSRWLTPPLVLFTTATNPFIWLLNASATGLLRTFKLRPVTERERVHSPEEIMMLVEQSQKTGKLGAQDARMIEGVFEFSEKNARDVMTPRTQMVALPADLSLDAAADRVAQAGRSRYPVYGESLDDIVGTVHAKEILRGLRAGGVGGVKSVLRAPLFVPGSREIEDVLADMKRQKVHLAIVLDEYDRPAESPAAGAAPVLDGATEIKDVNAAYGLQLPAADYNTVGGLVFGTLGRLPKPGDRVTVGAASFEVVEMAGRRVAKVRFLTSGARGP